MKNSTKKNSSVDRAVVTTTRWLWSIAGAVVVLALVLLYTLQSGWSGINQARADLQLYATDTEHHLAMNESIVGDALRDIDSILINHREQDGGGRWLARLANVNVTQDHSFHSEKQEELNRKFHEFLKDLVVFREQTVAQLAELKEKKTAIDEAKESSAQLVSRLTTEFEEIKGNALLSKAKYWRQILEAEKVLDRSELSELSRHMRSSRMCDGLTKELQEIRYWTKRICDVRSYSELENIKDNQLAPAFSRVHQLLQVETITNAFESHADTLTDLEIVLFSQPYAWDNERQTVKLGDQGLVGLVQKRLAIEQAFLLAESELAARQELGRDLIAQMRSDSESALSAYSGRIEQLVQGVRLRTYLILGPGTLLLVVCCLALPRLIREQMNTTIDSYRKLKQANKKLVWQFKMLKESQRKIKSQAIKLKRYTKEVERARKFADAANETKSQFLANVSHELRTPLTAIIGHTDLLEERLRGQGVPLETRRGLDTIASSGKHLLHIINDILDLTQVESGNLMIDQRDGNIVEVLLNTRESLRPSAKERGLNLDVNALSELPTSAKFDSVRITQVLFNLVENAIRFTELGSVTVNVNFIAKAQRLQVDVIDTGIGMTREQALRAFEPFGQADGGMTRKHGGLGIGLTISRRLVDMMGGMLELVDTEIGKGSHFRFVLPFVPNVNCSYVSSLETGLAGKTAVPPLPEIRLEGRILLVEDGVDNQRLISTILRKVGATVDIAENGEEGLKFWRRGIESNQTYDLIVSDMQMPVLDGYTMVRRLRSDGVKIPVVALTAHALPEDRHKCFDAGCNEFVTKPIDRRHLLEVLYQFCGEKRGGVSADSSVREEKVTTLNIS